MLDLVFSILGRLWDVYDKYQKNKDAAEEQVRATLEAVDMELARGADALDAHLADNDARAQAVIDKKRADATGPVDHAAPFDTSDVK